MYLFVYVYLSLLICFFVCLSSIIVFWIPQFWRCSAGLGIQAAFWLQRNEKEGVGGRKAPSVSRLFIVLLVSVIMSS